MVHNPAGTLDSGFRRWAYEFRNIADWLMITNCFSWGYERGIVIDNVSASTIIGCGADHLGTEGGSPVNPDAIGISLVKGSGISKWITVAECFTAAQGSAGIYIDLGDGVPVSIIGHRAIGGGQFGVLVNTGRPDIIGSIYENVHFGVGVSGIGSVAKIANNSFSDIIERPISINPANRSCIIGKNDYNNYAVAQSPVTPCGLPQVASASPLAAPSNYEVVEVTGTTGFSDINYGWAGRRLTLVFAASVTVSTGGGGQDSLRLASTFNAATGSTLSLVHNGAIWIETGRKA
jgi:hypothetical protein